MRLQLYGAYIVIGAFNTCLMLTCSLQRGSVFQTKESLRFPTQLCKEKNDLSCKLVSSLEKKNLILAWKDLILHELV